MGKRRGRGENISLREAYQRLLDSTNDRNAERVETGEEQLGPPPTYEVFRRIRNGHSRISDATASALATMLDVPIEDVYTAAKIRPRLGRFTLPTRADRLDDQQRQVVLSVIDAILQAGETSAEDEPKATRPRAISRSEAQEARRLRVIEQALPEGQAAYDEDDDPGDDDDPLNHP
ncbi:hypothetical protein [Nocardioides sp. Arc9.136]|uniref:hypothetical protein n=1 Tax=Nocardioides sp. Arc9.136 TaxID=2996826 RepID=UPI002666D5DA|nr:hypothetical protein [Nocardioides sp. Arc9.136]WKN47111.1 hypothetical protein OSR43_13795 [Nocardioides sp. Arc9.136]